MAGWRWQLQPQPNETGVLGHDQIISDHRSRSARLSLPSGTGIWTSELVSAAVSVATLDWMSASVIAVVWAMKAYSLSLSAPENDPRK